MRKAMLAGVLAAMMLTSTALAEVYEGTTVAAYTVQMAAEAGGVLESLTVEAGETVEEGDAIGSIRTNKVFATQDGTVARVIAGEGEEADGTVLELYGVERYRIYCTVDEAYQSAESTLVHSGEQLYIKCTVNGTHRGIGVVTEIDGAEFSVLTIGGELYVGETVYLYRDEDFSSSQRVGIGTVVTNDVEAYESDGIVVRMHVSEGEYVERGELLYETAEAESGSLTAPASGVVTSLSVSEGDRLQEGQSVLTIAPQDAFCVEIQLDETSAAKVAVGDAAELVFNAGAEEASVPGTVMSISHIAENEMYSVKIKPENVQGLRLGMTATVRVGDE